MQSLLSTFNALLSNVSLLEISLVALNLLVLMFSKPIYKWLLRAQSVSDEELEQRKTFTLFKRVNLLILLFVTLYSLFLPLNDHFGYTKLLSALLIISVAYLFDSMMNILITQRFGRLKTIEGESTYTETYRSRLLSFLTSLLLTVIVLIMIIRLIGFESLLETGGVIGFIGVLLALTQGSWAPDLIGGLIILNSQLVEEGDVIELDTPKYLIGVVFKTKVFHTELLSLSTNHRVMIPNAHLRQHPIQNLSKFASAKGLRDSLVFKIGYDVTSSRVTELFESALTQAVKEEGLPILSKYPLEIRVTDAGDFAIEWTVFYYTKEVKQLLKTRQLFRAMISKRASELDISLATPILYHREH